MNSRTGRRRRSKSRDRPASPMRGRPRPAARDVEFEYRNGKLEKVEDSTSRGLALRLYVDGRYSAHCDDRPEPGPAARLRPRGGRDHARAAARRASRDHASRAVRQPADRGTRPRGRDGRQARPRPAHGLVRGDGRARRGITERVISATSRRRRRQRMDRVGEQQRLQRHAASPRIAGSARRSRCATGRQARGRLVYAGGAHVDDLPDAAEHRQTRRSSVRSCGSDRRKGPTRKARPWSSTRARPDH